MHQINVIKQCSLNEGGNEISHEMDNNDAVYSFNKLSTSFCINTK